MHGIPKDLPLESLNGATLAQLAIGPHDIQFNFTQPTKRISVWGSWDLKNDAGELLDSSGPDDESYENRKEFRLLLLLNKSVVGHAISAPKSFTLRFDSGHTLTIYDDTDRYESFDFDGHIV